MRITLRRICPVPMGALMEVKGHLLTAALLARPGTGQKVHDAFDLSSREVKKATQILVGIMSDYS